MDTATLIGASGAALLLIGFVLQEFNVLKSQSYSYTFLNLIGAGLLTWYAVILDSLPFIILEGIWILVALWQIVRLASKR